MQAATNGGYHARPRQLEKDDSLFRGSVGCGDRNDLRNIGNGARKLHINILSEQKRSFSSTSSSFSCLLLLLGLLSGAHQGGTADVHEIDNDAGNAASQGEY